MADPYAKQNGYAHQQSPGFGQYGPQHNQQKAQMYQKGPPSRRKSDNIHQSNSHNYKYNGYQKQQRHHQYPQQQHNHPQQQQQQQQHYHNKAQQNRRERQHRKKQQQQEQELQQQQRQQRQRKQRRANSPTGFEQEKFFDDDNNKQPQKHNEPTPKQRMRQRRQQKNQQNQHQNNHYHHGSYKNNASPPPKRNPRRTSRSKSPYPNHSDHEQQQRRRTAGGGGGNRNPRRPKPNITNTGSEPQNNGYRNHRKGTGGGHMQAPANPDKVHRKSMPNPHHHQRRKQKSHTEHVLDDQNVEYHDYNNRNPRRAPPQHAHLDHHHERERKQRSKNGRRRTSKSPQRQPHPHPHPNLNGNDSGNNSSPSPLPLPDNNSGDQSRPTSRKRRNTTNPTATHNNKHRHHHQNDSGYRRQSQHHPNGRSAGRRSVGGKKRPSKSPNNRQLSSQEAKHAKLNKGKLAQMGYIIREKLGRGNFSVVRRIVRKSDQKEFAAKIISLKQMSQQEQDDLHEEVEILGKLKHHNIAQLIDYYVTPRHFYIVLELLNGGELFERITKRGRFTEQQAAHIARQIADALSYMHSKGVVHRDLKPENIIFASKDADSKIKISDFGLSRQTDINNKDKQLKTACGTPGYVAPEILKAQVYDEAVDLWSAGVIIYILLCGFPPFQGDDAHDRQIQQTQMFRKIKAGDYSFPSPSWDNISLVAKDCIDNLLTVNPKERINASELREHPWVKQAERQNNENILNSRFKSNLSGYLHKKRLRRGVRLIITLNRMIRAAGLEEAAREQRKAFRKKLKLYKEELKAKQREVYNRQQRLKLMNVDSNEDEFVGITIINPDDTPAIDYSKVK